MVAGQNVRTWKSSRGSLVMTGLAFVGLAAVTVLCLVAAFTGDEAAMIVWGSIGAVAALGTLYTLLLLISSSKQKIEVSEAHIDLTVLRSAWWPVLRRVTVAPSDIAAIEIRQEVFQAPKDPNKPHATRARTLVEIGSLTTRSGESINFAYTSTGSLPVEEIATVIGSVTGLAVQDHGARRRGMFGVSNAALLPWEGQRVQKAELYKLPMGGGSL